MLRWRSKKAEASTNTLGSRLRLEGSLLSGICDWSYDPFYRPMIGIFVKGRLVRVVPTFRRPSPVASTGWACRFECDLGSIANGKDGFSVVCLETGEVLNRSLKTIDGSRSKKEVLEVKDLIDLADRGTSRWDAGGFMAFLDLAIPDQVDFMYRCILERGADPGGLESFAEQIQIGRMTILDLRDIMVTGDEFRDRIQNTIYSRLGHWIVWGGLQDVLPSLFLSPVPREQRRPGVLEPAPDSLMRSSLEVITEARPARDYLSALAVGSDADADLRRRWESENTQPLKEISDTISERKKARTNAVQESQSAIRRMEFGGLLGALRIGDAGVGLADRIKSRAGLAGCVFFGPYLRLQPGDYRISLHLHARCAAPYSSGQISLEVCYGDLLVSVGAIPSSLYSQATHEFLFRVPASDHLREANFEFRLFSDGSSEFEVYDVRLAQVPTITENDTPNNVEMLPVLQIGPATLRTDRGLLAPRTAEGHVFYGPYRTIFSGNYVLSVALECIDGAKKVAKLEFAPPSGASIEREFAIERGAQRLELFFHCAPSAEGLVVSPPVEFRLWKPTGMEIEVHSVVLSRIDQSLPE